MFWRYGYNFINMAHYSSKHKHGLCLCSYRGRFQYHAINDVIFLQSSILRLTPWLYLGCPCLTLSHLSLTSHSRSLRNLAGRPVVIAHVTCQEPITRQNELRNKMTFNLTTTRPCDAVWLVKYWCMYRINPRCCREITPTWTVVDDATRPREARVNLPLWPEMASDDPATSPIVIADDIWTSGLHVRTLHCVCGNFLWTCSYILHFDMGRYDNNLSLFTPITCIL